MTKVKLYNENGEFVRMHDMKDAGDYFNEVKKLNAEQLFVKRQFNKSGKLVRSYAGQFKQHVS
jgi:hypothetical protein